MLADQIDFHDEVTQMRSVHAVPKHTKGALCDYLIRGWEPGGFATAMLASDLERALYCADVANRQAFHAIAMWIREHCPVGAWGSYEAVAAWCEDKDGKRTAYVDELKRKEVWAQLKQ